MAPMMMRGVATSSDITSGSWILTSDSYSGTFVFYNDGTGLAVVKDKPEISFSWNEVSENNYEAHMFLITIPFTYDPETDMMTSVQYPGASLQRSGGKL
jgi:hypothetical protein